MGVYDAGWILSSRQRIAGLEGREAARRVYACPAKRIETPETEHGIELFSRTRARF
ncbi:MAG: hypothetical protein ACLT98_09800 [Eggerthellaceae bacterium]